jgi:hypothetical protein
MRCKYRIWISSRLAEESFPPSLQLPLAHGPPHQLGDDRTLVLITEGFVERRLAGRFGQFSSAPGDFDRADCE